ncbi:MAG: GNAT family N-acetyltransferase [Bacteroidota bacterium]
MSTEIRTAEIADLACIQSLAHEIWPLVYSNMISENQIEFMLNWMYAPEKLKQDVMNGVIFLLVSENDKDCGFLAFEMKEHETFLHKLYLHPELHGKGIGKQMIRQVELAAKDNNSDCIRLTVNRNNPNVAFYLNRGFEVEEEKDFDIGGGYWMNDFIMKKNLK